MWLYGLGNLGIRRAARILEGAHAGVYLTDRLDDPIVCAGQVWVPPSDIEGRQVLLKPILLSRFPYGFVVEPP